MMSKNKHVRVTEVPMESESFLSSNVMMNYVFI
jgi:hypothetical protein